MTDIMIILFDAISSQCNATVTHSIYSSKQQRSGLSLNNSYLFINKPTPPPDFVTRCFSISV